ITCGQSFRRRFRPYFTKRQLSTLASLKRSIAGPFAFKEPAARLKDIFVAVHSVRYPESAELDPEQISEERRRKIIGYEKLLLETICFDFQQRHPYTYIVKFVKWIQ
ncbi:hypothetical protein BX666DRAFT_1842420, partial [Dichotomocladium elegans]